MKMFLFDRNQKVKRWLVDRDFIEAKMMEQINAADQLTFSVPLNKRLPSSYFYAAIPQPRGSGYLLFKIVTEKVSSDQIEYTAVESAYDELKSYHYIKDVRPENRKAGELLQTALEGTRWQVGQTYDSGTFSTNFYYISTLEAIQKIVELCGLEVTFEITLNPKTHKIEHRLVNLYAQQGQRTGKRFEYGSNLLTVEHEESAENLITALIGRGKGEAVYHEDNTAEETPDGYGRRINFADVVWSKKNGNPADKPAGQEYVEDVDATAKYGFDDGKPRIGIEIFEDITDPAELLQATWSALQTLKRPQASFRASVMDVGDLGLGDTVAIVRHDIKIEYFTRVYKVTHNLLDERQNTIELGDDFSGSSITSTVNNLGRSVGAVGQLANYAAVSANGKNANYYGQAQPINPLEGDLWYKDLGNGETDMYQYHAGNWILITSTRDLHNVEKQVKQAQDDFKTAWNKAVAADSSAAKAQQRADDVGEQLQSAQADFDSRLTTAMANASSATAKAQQRADDVGKQLQSAQADFDSKLSAASASASAATAKAQQRADDVGKQLQSAQADFNSKLSAASASASAATAKAQQRADDVGKQLQSAQADFNSKLSAASASASAATAKAQQRADDVGEQLQSAQANFDSRLTTAMANASSATAKAQQRADDVGKQLQSAQSDFDSKLSAASVSASAATDKAMQAANAAQDDVNAQIKEFNAYKSNAAKTYVDNSTFNSYKSATSTTINDNKATADQNLNSYKVTVDKTYVAKGTVISNVNTEANASIFSTDNKLYMDAATTVFSGKAFIPNAAIINLTASKLTAGTIDASKISVVNLNASNINTGTLNASLIKAGSMSADRIVGGTLDFKKIDVSNLSADNIVSGTLDASKVSVINLNASNINTGTLNASLIKAGSMSADRIVGGTLNFKNVAVANLSADNIVSGTLDASKVSVINLDASNINAGSLNAGLIKAGSMSADRIVGGTLNFKNVGVSNLSAGNIVSGTLDASKVAVINLNASNINAGSLNAGLIKAGSMSADRIVGGTLDFKNVTVANLSAGSIVSGTLDASEISVINLNASNINTGTLNASLIKAGSMSADRIVGGTLDFKNVAVANLSAGSIISGTLDASKVSVINLNASNIKTGSLNAGLIKVGSMSADRIVGGTLNFKNIGVSNLSAGNIVSGTLDAAKVAVINLNASNIKTGTLDASLIKAGSMSADRIVGGTLDFSKINAGSLSADKITSGTLNAGKVNVINLNANNITSGTINGQNLKIDLNTGEILFQKGKIASTNSLLNINVDNGTMSVVNSLGDGAYFKDGNIELTNSTLWNNGEKPAYGKISFAKDMLEKGNDGIEIQGTKGWIIHSGNFDYDKTTWGQHFFANEEKTGTAIGGDEEHIDLQAYDEITLTAGAILPTNLDAPSSYLNNRPYLSLGGNHASNSRWPSFAAKSNLFLFAIDNVPTATLEYGRSYFKDTQYSYIFRATTPRSSIDLSDDAGHGWGRSWFSVTSDNTTVISFDANGINGLPKRRTYIPNLTAGSLNVTGSKNAIVPTSAGATLINAYETAEYYFGDIGESTTDKSYVAQITIDPLFLETINTSVPYQVFLSSYDNATVWVESRTANLFVVRSSKPNVRFCWELKAKRKGYEDKRLEVDDSISAENLRKQVEKNEQ